MAEFNATDELELLQEKRGTLERAVRIAAAIEQLQRGLQATLEMGKPAGNISSDVLNHFAELDEKTKILPTVKVKSALHGLETKVRDGLRHIMDIAENGNTDVDTSGESGKELDSLGSEQLLNQFRRSAQTAVALRLILRGRGEPAKPLAIQVPAKILRKQILELQQKELQCRQRVRKEIIEMLVQTKNFLNRSDLPEKMRGMIQDMRDDLKVNLSHIDRGESIESMPIAMELIEMGEEPTKFQVATSSVSMEPTTEPRPVVEPEKPKPQVNIRYRHRKAASKPFIYKLWRWCTTPSSVTWGDIENETKRRLG